MVEDFFPDPDSEGQLLTEEDQDLLSKVQVQEGDAALFPQELILEPEKEYTPELRQNLYQRVLTMNVPQKIRLAMLGNQEARNLLIHDPNKVIQLAVLRSPKITENEVLNVAQQKNVSEDVLLTIVRHKNWVKNYLIKLAIASNPKTPLPISMKLLDHFHDKDLQALSRNKNISSVLARAAARVIIKRSG